jgi:hypothetical protein
MKQLRKAQQILGELNDAEIRRSLAANLEQPRENASGHDPEQAKLSDSKNKNRLLRRAAIVYRKIAG